MVSFNFLSKFVVKIFLAKFLLPEDFGLITICFLIISLAEIISDFGLSSVIIQKNFKNDSKILSTIFWFSCILGLIIFGSINILITPIFISFYQEPVLKSLILIVSLSLLYNPLILIHRTILHRDLDFKKIFYINVTSLIISAVISIYMAINNYGVWALVLQYFSSTLISFLFYFLSVNWKPMKTFNLSSLISILKKGVYDLFAKIVGYFSTYSQTIILSIYLSITDIGYFNFAMLFTISILEPFNKSIRKVFFPFFSKIKSNKDRIKENHLNQITISLCVFIPFLTFLYFYSETLLQYLFQNKWNESVVILKYLSVFVFLKLMGGTPNVIIKSLGHFNQFFFLQLIRSLILIGFLLVGIEFYELRGMLLAMIIAQIVLNIVDYIFLRKKISLRLIEIGLVLIKMTLLSVILISLCYIQSHIYEVNLIFGFIICLTGYLISYLYLFKLEKIKL
tara:strand:- start:17796 stop:19154 length:1359 start_codon:yes stop_codon:yes gene_type:complete